MSRTAIFNPSPRIEVITLETGSTCVVIDDALLDPEALVQTVIAGSEIFEPAVSNFYPGILCAAPAAISVALAEFFNQHMRRLFDARRLLDMHCRLSMVTKSPHDLAPLQCLCHRDRMSLDVRHSIQASILYLFRDPDLGGTSFYRSKHSEEQTDTLYRDAATLERSHFFAKYGLNAEYLSHPNPHFARVGHIEARWNRMIFFDGFHFHSGDISAPDRMSPNPAEGRLTLNGFFTSRRHLKVAAVKQ